MTRPYDCVNKCQGAAGRELSLSALPVLWARRLQQLTLAAQVSAALTAGSVLLALSLIAALGLIVPAQIRHRMAVQPRLGTAPFVGRINDKPRTSKEMA